MGDLIVSYPVVLDKQTLNRAPLTRNNSGLADIFGGRTHDTAVIELVLQVMGDPAGDARRGKQRGEQFFRNSQHMISQARIEVDIGGDHRSPALHDDLLDNILKQFVEGEFIHAALFFREAAAQLAHSSARGSLMV